MRAADAPVTKAAAIITGTIAAGESLSSAIDCSTGPALYVIMPDEWDGANLSFLISPDDVTYHDVFNHIGQEVTAACRPGAAVYLGSDSQVKASFLKIRSGTAADPIAQTADRTFQLVF